MGSRVDEARRLELSRPTAQGDLVFGELGGFKVLLEGEPPFSGFRVELGRVLPLAHLTLRTGERNDPDVLHTGDADFDDALEVLATPGHTPTLARLFDASTRAAALEFFRAHPFARLEASSLHVPCEQGVSSPVVQAATALARQLVTRFDEVGLVAREAPPELPVEAKALDLSFSQAEDYSTEAPEAPTEPEDPALLAGVAGLVLSATALQLFTSVNGGPLLLISVTVGMAAGLAWKFLRG